MSAWVLSALALIIPFGIAVALSWWIEWRRYQRNLRRLKESDLWHDLTK